MVDKYNLDPMIKSALKKVNVKDRLKTIEGIESVYYYFDSNQITCFINETYWKNKDRIKLNIAKALDDAGLFDSIEKINLVMA